MSAALEHNVDTLLVGVVKQIRLRQPDYISKHSTRFDLYLRVEAGDMTVDNTKMGPMSIINYNRIQYQRINQVVNNKQITLN